MKKMYQIINHELIETTTQDKANWINIETPASDELTDFKNNSGLPAHILKDVFDIDEMPHIDTFKEHLIIFVDIPVIVAAVPSHQTRPFCLFLKEQQVFTISGNEFNLYENLKLNYIDDLLDIKDLLIVILYTIMAKYIESIKEMENSSNWSTEKFVSSQKENTMLFELLDLQKSLIDYQTSIESNHLVIEQLTTDMNSLFSPYQIALLKNLTIESNQITQMCSVFGTVLDSISNISESVISNNLNDLMKTLASLTILSALPTIIISVYTMNTEIPAPYNNFVIPIFASVIICVITAIILKKRNML